MKIVAIAAVGKNGVIGKGASLPWDIPEDMKFFREATRDQIVIMGRKTYQSLGKALPKRQNAVITRDASFQLSDAAVFHDLNSAIQAFDRAENSGKILFIIGGAEIYRLSFPVLDEIWLTEIDQEFDGDVFFPEYRDGKLHLPDFERHSSVKQKDTQSTPLSYRFSVFKRNR